MLYVVFLSTIAFAASLISTALRASRLSKPRVMTGKTEDVSKQRNKTKQKHRDNPRTHFPWA